MDIKVFRHFNRSTNEEQYDMPTELPRRPKELVTLGKEILLRINSYNITDYPTKTVHQYDVSLD